jgi:hypothetical protein
MSADKTATSLSARAVPAQGTHVAATSKALNRNAAPARDAGRRMIGTRLTFMKNSHDGEAFGLLSPIGSRPKRRCQENPEPCPQSVGFAPQLCRILSLAQTHLRFQFSTIRFQSCFGNVSGRAQSASDTSRST